MPIVSRGARACRPCFTSALDEADNRLELNSKTPRSPLTKMSKEYPWGKGDQGPRSNFEIGRGGTISAQKYWGGGGGGVKTLFLILNLYNFKNIGGGGGTCPPAPLLRGPWG